MWILAVAGSIGCSYSTSDYVVDEAGRSDSAADTGSTDTGGNVDTNPTCTGGLTNCSGKCVDLQTDNANCGQCDHPCDPGNRCKKAVCN